MKKEALYLLGGLAVGATLFFVFKDSIFGGEDEDGQEKSLGEGAITPPVSTTQTSQQTIAVQPPTATQQVQDVPLGAPTEVLQQAEVRLPYDLVEIDSQFANSSAYTDLFGGCDFPIKQGSQSVCVQRVQDALDIPKTGAFDDVTQFALDKYIEKLPNRSDSHFDRFTREGCIAFDPVTNQTTNVCGLNHDQYLDILFKMGIPLNETYDA